MSVIDWVGVGILAWVLAAMVVLLISSWFKALIETAREFRQDQPALAGCFESLAFASGIGVLVLLLGLN